MSTSEKFREHVEALEAKALAGDEFATRSLCAIALLAEGWRPGDPEPAVEISVEELPDYVRKLLSGEYGK